MFELCTTSMTPRCCKAIGEIRPFYVRVAEFSSPQPWCTSCLIVTEFRNGETENGLKWKQYVADLANDMKTGTTARIELSFRDYVDGIPITPTARELERIEACVKKLLPHFEISN